MDLLEADVLGDDPEQFRSFELSATVYASLRRDAAARDTVLSAATARSGITVDARFYARDLLFDGSRVAARIRSRRLETAVGEAADDRRPPPTAVVDAAAAAIGDGDDAAPEPTDTLRRRFAALSASTPPRLARGAREGG